MSVVGLAGSVVSGCTRPSAGWLGCFLKLGCFLSF